MGSETKIDKSGWGPGPWQDEPDKLEFAHDGFPCLILRTQMGHLCGYVAVPSGHPWHGVDYSGYPDGRPLPDPECHGGVTYAGRCRGGICHVPKPGESDDVWWLGFDHAHLGDASPGTDALLSSLNRSGRGHGDSYKTVEFVRRGCESLAEQAKAAQS